MNKLLSKLKGLGGLILGGLLSLIFTGNISGQLDQGLMYGSPALPSPLYGVTSKVIFFRTIPYIVVAFLIFVVAPIIGLIWYKKRGGTKKWVSYLLWAIIILFILALVALTALFLYSYLRY